MKDGTNHIMKNSGNWKNIILTGAFWILILAAIWVFADRLMINGVFAWHMEQKEYHAMMAETALLFCLFCVIGGMWRKRPRKGPGVILTAAVLSFFLWAHAVFLPVAVSVIYLLYIALAGRFLAEKLLGIKEWGAGFLTGCLSLILVFCLMSGLGMGAVGCLRLFAAGTGAALLCYYGWRWRADEGKRVQNSIKGKLSGCSPLDQGIMSWGSVLAVSFILTMFCIQAGRMNIAVDYDSLWYGVRSPFILDNGGGIYENLGTIGIVYTYSKGFEVLMLPLSDLPSYSFLLSANLWLTAGVLWLSCRIGRMLVGKRSADRGLVTVFCALLAAVPGIMNMGITAKSDTATLFFQVFLVYCMLRYINGEDHPFHFLAMGAAAFFLTWTMKPTAMVFSTAVGGMSLVFILWKRLVPGRRDDGSKTQQNIKGSLILTAMSLIALAGMWARTFIMTGLPVTSVFSSLVTKLGFKMKYPFHISEIPSNGTDLTFLEGVRAFGKRLFEFLICPEGEDMAHVILAWGGFFLFFLFLTGLLCLFVKKTAQRAEDKLTGQYFYVVYIPFLIVNLVSLYLLGQVDGNYFMLLYVFSGFLVLRLIGRVESASVKKGVGAGAVVTLLFLGVVTSLTNWNWTLGFTPVQFAHRGYYNHREIKRQEMAAKGNGPIWDILAADPSTRAIGVGEHPGVLAFPCNIQSYDDITGSWGNVVLVKTMDNFVEFMTYAKTEYVYVQAGYMGEEERCYSLVRTLIEYGKLEPVCCEEGNVLAAVRLDGEKTEETTGWLTEFDNCYIKRK